jgi:hypothetical protein
MFRGAPLQRNYVFMRIYAGNNARRREQRLTDAAYIALRKERLPVDTATATPPTG